MAMTGLQARLAGRDSREGVGVTWTAGHDRDSWTSMNTCPSVGCVSNSRFMAHVDDADASPGRQKQNFIQMIAHKGEYLRDTQFRNRPDEKLSSSWHKSLNPFPVADFTRALRFHGNKIASDLMTS
jgi:hypothetical protein